MHVFFDIVERFPNDKKKRRRWPLINFQFKNVCFIYLASLSSLLLECTMKYFRCIFYKNLSISNKFLNKNNNFKKWNSHSFVFQYNQMNVTRNFNKRRQTRDYSFCSFLLFSSHVTLTTWTQDTSVCWYTIMDTLFHWFFYTWQNKNTRFSRKISRFSSSNPFPQVLLNQFNISAFVFAHFQKIFLQQFQ